MELDRILSEKGQELAKSSEFLEAVLLRKIIETYQQFGNPNHEVLVHCIKLGGLVLDHYEAFGGIRLYTANPESLFEEKEVILKTVNRVNPSETPLSENEMVIENLLWRGIQTAERDYTKYLETLEIDIYEKETSMQGFSEFFDSILQSKIKTPNNNKKLEDLSNDYQSLQTEIESIRCELKKEGIQTSKYNHLKRKLINLYEETGGLYYVKNYEEQNMDVPEQTAFLSWEEIFQNPDLSNDLELIGRYKEIIEEVATKTSGKFRKFYNEDKSLDHIAAITEVLVMTPDDLNFVFLPDEQKTFKSATKIVALIWRCVSGTYISSSYFKNITKKIREQEFDIHKPIGEILEDELLVDEDVSNSEYASQETSFGEDTWTAKDQILNTTAAAIITQAENYFEGLKEVNIYPSFPATTDQIDRIISDTKLRHLAQDKRYILPLKNLYTKSDAIILYLGIQSRQRFAETNKTGKLVQRIKKICELDQ